jgi:hypothetical protein
VSHSSSRGEPLRTIREMQEFVARSLRSLLHVMQDNGARQHVADQARRVNRWVLGIARHAQAPAPQFGLPRVAVPAWWRLVEEFESVHERWTESLPHNWRALSMTELRAVADTMELTGWVLAWVPREEILRHLIASLDRPDAHSRLLTCQDDVLDDLQKSLVEITDPSLADLSIALQQAIRAYEVGSSFPAQALVAVVLASLISQQLEDRTPAESPLLAFRRNSLLRAGGTALNSYWPRPGDPVPSLFNPYATAHRFDLTHFTQANALAGLVLGVSFVRDLQAAAQARG